MPFVNAESLRVHYVEQGEGPPVLLLHGWPTSSFLWRNIMPEIAKNNRVIAIDLPGFGQSDKPLDVSYSYRFYERVITAVLDALEVSDVGLCVHDLGGPLGLYWATKNKQRVRELALLNTLVYAKVSWAVIAFGAACRLPGMNRLLSSQWGLRASMRVGTVRPECLTEELYEGVTAPFRNAQARSALIKTVLGLSPKGRKEIESALPSFQCPVRLIYGEQDRILPDVAKTMKRVAGDLPQSETTAVADCGHFLQEDAPAAVAPLLAEFFAPKAGADSPTAP